MSASTPPQPGRNHEHDDNPRLLTTTKSAYVGYHPNFLSAAELRELLAECKTSLVESCEYRQDVYGRQGRQTAYFGDDNCAFRFCEITLQPQAWPPVVAKVRRKLDAAIRAWVEDGTIDCFDAAAGGENEIEKNKIVDTSTRDHLSLTACLLNWYQQDKDFIPWHADYVGAHGPAKLVISLTVCGERPMLLRRLRRKDHHHTRIEDGLSKAGAAAAASAKTKGSVVKETGEESSQDEVETGLDHNSADIASSSPEERETSREDEAMVMLQPGSLLIMAGNTQQEVEHHLPLEYQGQTFGDERFSLTFRSIVPDFHKDCD